MRQVIRAQDAPKPRGIYSQAIVSSGFVFVSGQVPVDPATGEIETGGIKAQVRRTLRNIELVLEAAGSSLRDAVKLGVFLADLDDLAAMNEVFGEFFPDGAPARTTVGSQLPNVKVEIDCIARQRKTRLNRRSA